LAISETTKAIEAIFSRRYIFAMTINKTRGQPMQICGLDFENSCFSRGQLYVACSSVGKLLNYAESGETKNILHELAMQQYEC